MYFYRGQENLKASSEKPLEAGAAWCISFAAGGGGENFIYL
jgi:hypothetical protein